MSYGIYKLYDYYRNKEKIKDNNSTQLVDYEGFNQGFDLIVQEQQEKREAKQTIATILYPPKWLDGLPEEILQIENQRLDLEARASKSSLFQNQKFKTTM